MHAVATASLGERTSETRSPASLNLRVLGSPWGSAAYDARGPAAYCCAGFARKVEQSTTGHTVWSAVRRCHGSRRSPHPTRI